VALRAKLSVADHCRSRATLPTWLHEGMAMLPSPAKLPTGSHLLILLPLIAGVIVPARQALALSACYADALGTWRGPVLNGLGVEDMITTFYLVPLHSDFDRLTVPWFQCGQVGPINQDSDTPRHPRAP
jgi:hypothetical protein